MESDFHTDRTPPTRPEATNTAWSRIVQLFDRLNPTVAFADGKFKISDFSFSAAVINSNAKAANLLLEKNPEAMEKHVLTEFQPEGYLPALFNKGRFPFELHYVAPIATGRRLAFRVIITFADESTAHEAILVQKDVRQEQLYSQYLKLIDLNSFGVVSGTDVNGDHCGAYELVGGKNLTNIEPNEYAGFENQIAAELGANFYAAYVLGKENRGRANYIFNPTGSHSGQLITGIDHEDIFMLDPHTLRKTAYSNELAILEDLPTYDVDRVNLLKRFEEAVIMQRSIVLAQRDAVEALVINGNADFQAEFNSRLDSNPLDVLDCLYTIRARMEQNVFAVMKRSLLGRW